MNRFSFNTIMTCDWWLVMGSTMNTNTCAGKRTQTCTYKQQSFIGMNVTIHRLCDFAQPTKSPIIFCFHIAIDCWVSLVSIQLNICVCVICGIYIITDWCHIDIVFCFLLVFTIKKKLFTSMSLHDSVSEKGFFAFICSCANILVECCKSPTNSF